MLFPTLIYFGACVHLSQRWDNISSVLGEMSYPLYLLHIPLLLPLYGHVFQRLFALRPGLTPPCLPIVVPVYVDLVVGGQALRQARAQASYSPI